MYRVDQSKNIYLSRGDDFSYTFPVYVDNSTTPYHFTPTDGCMLFFYIFLPNSINYQYVLRKTFKTNGEIITDIMGNDFSDVTYDNDNIDEKGNIIVRLTPDDTMSILPGEYKYQLRVQVLDEDDNLVLKTVTNRKDFYVIEDDYSNRVW